MNLISELHITPQDTLVSCGDLLDKGPFSHLVVSYLRTLGINGCKVVLVCGNHEERHARYRKAIATSPKEVSKFKNWQEMETITEQLSDKDIEFLDSAVLFHPLPEYNAVVVHGGILPDIERLPTPREFAALSRGERERLLRVLRVRYLTEKRTVDLVLEAKNIAGMDLEPEVGAHITLSAIMEAASSDVETTVTHKKVKPKWSFIPLGEEGPKDPFWADVYDGRFGRVYFGHSPYPELSEPKQFKHATGLDLGCVFGGRLCAAVLELGKEWKHVSVPAIKKYATSYWETDS